MTPRKLGLFALFALSGGLVLAALILVVAPAGATEEVATGPGGRAAVRGQIENLLDDGFTLDSPRGTLRVTINAQTRYRVIGLVNPTFADLAVGDHLLVRGQRQEASLLAAFVARVPDGDRLAGRIETVNNLELSLTGRGGEAITIFVNPDTWLAIDGADYTWDGDPPGREQLLPGMPLIAIGTSGGNGQALAADTLVVPPRPRLKAVAGEVETMTAEGFSLHTRFGRDLTVLVDEKTRFRLPSAGEPGLNDLNLGDRIVVVGRPLAEGQFLAKHIVTRPNGPTFVGQIVTITGAELVVDTRHGRTITVLIETNTRFLIPGNPGASLADFAEGDVVLVSGQWTEDGNMLARGLAKRSAR